jgi:hypothetical protein
MTEASEGYRTSTECEDGFRPGNTGPVTRIADVRCASPGFFSIFDDALPADLGRQGYEFTCAQDAPWGTFVPLDAVLGEGAPGATDDPLPLATALLRCLFARGGAAHERVRVEAPRAHGFAVWALASPAGTEVPYHLDYVEQYRLATNIIHCPLVAGTLQLSPGFDPAGKVGVPMDGGVFSAALEGIAHYRRFGHRLRLSSAAALGADIAAEADAAAADAAAQGGSSVQQRKQRWLHVPYRSNRATVHDGTLPHLSSRVNSLPPGTKRVIMGFNLFDLGIGPTVARVPMHSVAFKRTEKLAAVFGQLHVARGAKGEAGQSAKIAGMKLSDLAAFAREKGKDHAMTKFLLKVAKAISAQQQQQEQGGGQRPAAMKKAPCPRSMHAPAPAAAKGGKPPQRAFRAVVADERA